jgi:hypothetical protein
MRSAPARARERAAAVLALTLATLAVAACHMAPSFGAARVPFLIAGCTGWAAALALANTRRAERSGLRGAVATLALLLALGSSIVLLLVCASATWQTEE